MGDVPQETATWPRSGGRGRRPKGDRSVRAGRGRQRDVRVRPGRRILDRRPENVVKACGGTRRTRGSSPRTRCTPSGSGRRVVPRAALGRVERRVGRQSGDGCVGAFRQHVGGDVPRPPSRPGAGATRTVRARRSSPRASTARPWCRGTRATRRPSARGRRRVRERRSRRRGRCRRSGPWTRRRRAARGCAAISRPRRAHGEDEQCDPHVADDLERRGRVRLGRREPFGPAQHVERDPRAAVAEHHEARARRGHPSPAAGVSAGRTGRQPSRPAGTPSTRARGSSARRRGR